MLQSWGCLMAAFLMTTMARASRFYHLHNPPLYMGSVEGQLFDDAHRRMVRAIDAQVENIVPTSLDQLKAMSSDKPKILSFGPGCNLMLQSVLSITVLSVEECENGPPSLKALLDYFRVSDLGHLSDILEPEQYEFTQLDIQNRDDTISVKAKSKQSIEFLDGKVILDSKAELKLTFPSLMSGFPLDQSEAKWNGFTKVFQKKSKVTLYKAERNPYYTLEIKPEPLLVKAWVEFFDMEPADLIKIGIDFDVERLTNIIVQDPLIRGEVTKDAYQLLCKGKVEQEPLMSGADILAVASRARGRLPKLAVLIKTQGNHNIAKILKTYTAQASYLDNDAKIIKDLDKRMVLIVSQARVQKVMSEDLKPFWDPFTVGDEKKEGWVPLGVHIKTQVHVDKASGIKAVQRNEISDAIITDLQLKAEGFVMNFAEELRAEAENAINEFFGTLPAHIREFVSKIIEIKDTVNEYVEIKEFQIGDLPSKKKSGSGGGSESSGGSGSSNIVSRSLEKARRVGRITRDISKGSVATIETMARDAKFDAMQLALYDQVQDNAVKRSTTATASSRQRGDQSNRHENAGTGAGRPGSSTAAADDAGENSEEETPEKKASILSIHVKKRIQLIEGPKIFSIPELELYIKYLEEKWTFSAEAKFEFETQTVPVTIAYEDGVYTFKIAFDRISLADIVRVVVAPSYISPAAFIPGLDQIAIKNFQFVGKFGDTFRLRIAGTPSFFGFEKVHLEGYIWEKEDKSKAMAFGVVVEAIRLDELLESIFGGPVLPATFLSEVTGFLIISDTKASGEQKVEEGKTKEEDSESQGSSGTSGGAASGGEAGRRPSRQNKTGVRVKHHKAKKEQARQLLRFNRASGDPDGTVKQMGPAEWERLYRQVAVEVDENAIPKTNVPIAQNTNSKRRLRNWRRGAGKGSTESKDESGSKRQRNRNRNQGGSGSAQSSNSRPTTTGTAASTAGQDSSSSAKATENSTDDADAEEKEEEEKEEEVDEDMKFTLKDLVGKDIDKGVQFKARFTPPKREGECKGDNLCKFLQEKMNPDDYVEISGSFKVGEFEIKGEVNMERPLTENFKFLSASLELKYANKDSSISLACKLAYDNGKDIKLEFEGSISLKVTGEVSLRFSMSGHWKKPFGFPYLIIKQILLGIGYTPGAPLPSLEFGADIFIGDVDAVEESSLIHLVGYFGFNPVDPQQNFVYASGTGLTLGGVIKAFNLDVELPKFISDTGFPDEVTFSFSASGKEIESAGIEVKQGVYFKGTFNFLGYEVKAEINIVVKKPEEMTSGGWPFEKFLVDIEMSPFSMSSGLIALQRSSTDSTKGPKAYINFEPGKVPEADIQGYVTVLGISSETSIILSDSEFRFSIAGSVFGIFHSSLSINATYGSVAEMSFAFRGCISVDATQIAQIIKEALQRASRAATAAKEKATEKLNDAKAFLDRANRGLESWKKSIVDRRNELIERCKALEEKKRKLEQGRCQDQCGKVCIPFLDWKSHCWKIWWWWVGCPYWNSCRWEVHDPICMAGCEIKKAINKISLWAEKLGIKIMIGFTHFGEALLTAAQKFLEGAKKLVDLAQAVVNAVEAVVQVGLNIAAAIAKFTLESIVIEEFCIGGSLDSNFDACVDVVLKARFFGATVDYAGKKCINFNFFKIVGNQMAETKYPGIQKMQEDLGEVDGKFAEIDESKGDLNKEENRIDEDVKDEVTNTRRSKIPRRPSAMTKEDAWIHRVADMTVPQISLKREDVIRRFEASSLAGLVKDYDPLKTADHRIVKDTIEKPTDLFNEEVTNGPCHEVRSVVTKYSQLQDGLRTLSQSLAYQKRMFISTRDAMRRSVQSLEDQVRDSLNKYNATTEDKEAMFYWRDKAKNDVEGWIKMTTKALKAQRRTAISGFRGQLDAAFLQHKKTDVASYINQLHENASKAMKRATLPTAASTEAENGLLRIKRSLVNILNEKDVKTKGFENVVDSLSSDIIKTRSLLDKCEQV